MKKFRKYNYYLYIAVQIAIGIDIIYRCRDSISRLLIFFGLFLIITINEYFRGRIFHKEKRSYYISITVSMIIGIILAFNVQGYSDLYIYMILYELISFTEGKSSNIFIASCIVLIISIPIFRVGSKIDIVSVLMSWKDNILDLLMAILGVLFYSISLLGYRALRLEKRKVDRLNRELDLSNNILKEQSEEIEELTITKERNRVAGEIHDNLGHSLIALNMNLDVAEKIMDSDIIKAKELISKSHVLAKESMDNLRMAVYALKDNRTSTLRDSLETIINNLESTGNVQVIVNMGDRTEELLPEYKDIIYTTIKESLTNSMKHGLADKIYININIDGDNLHISIRDNGIGCSKLVKGNGLLGIEERIGKYGGKVSYCSSGVGFLVGVKWDKIFT